ncbi:large subunit ribosomal protein L39e [Nematocida homosporus]|uniref:large subunit ribosomal protein L39e n=1 Tax=Nematocida homosporus TaxID=1912981 RepID=UPI00221E893A|nr:large subunit ribosomal protein L39e [Nematocida homosporus]KAI5186842.1 large subunit ribosomal protein L39e [Nematocida homosporus]
MTANKGGLLKRRLIRANRSNKPVPAWKRVLPGNTQHYNAKRRHYRRTKLKYHE